MHTGAWIGNYNGVDSQLDDFCNTCTNKRGLR